MYFGEFLVGNSVLTKDELVDIVITQLNKMPNVFEILKRDKLLNIDQIYKLILKQLSSKTSVLEILTQENYLDKKIIDKISDEQMGKGGYLGEHLLEKKTIDSSKLSSLLQEFNGTKESAVDNTVEKIDVDFIDTFEKCLSETQIMQIKIDINLLSKNDIVNDLHLIKGAAQLIRAEFIVQLIDYVETKISNLVNEEERALLHQIVSFIGDLSNAITKDKSEIGFLEVETHKIRYSSIMDNLNNIKDEK